MMITMIMIMMMIIMMMRIMVKNNNYYDDDGDELIISFLLFCAISVNWKIHNCFLTHNLLQWMFLCGNLF
jgi:hypothetical protein